MAPICTVGEVTNHTNSVVQPENLKRAPGTFCEVSYIFLFVLAIWEFILKLLMCVYGQKLYNEEQEANCTREATRCHLHGVRNTTVKETGFNIPAIPDGWSSLWSHVLNFKFYRQLNHVSLQYCNVALLSHKVIVVLRMTSFYEVKSNTSKSRFWLKMFLSVYKKLRSSLYITHGLKEYCFDYYIIILWWYKMQHSVLNFV